MGVAMVCEVVGKGLASALSARSASTLMAWEPRSRLGRPAMRSRKAVHAALSMALVMVLLGMVYLSQQAPFLGSVQVFVYTGAVMMLFLFVLMLTGRDAGDSIFEPLRGQRMIATVIGIAFVTLVVTGPVEEQRAWVEARNVVSDEDSTAAEAVR